MGGGSADVGEGLKLLGAVELLRNDGPWVVPEHLRKTNAVLTLSDGTRAEGWSTSLMAYEARWDSTDQIPQRAIDAGLDRFGSLDPTSGGRTQRNSLSGEWHRNLDGRSTKVAAYAIDYRLKLFSNFTYALERPRPPATSSRSRTSATSTVSPPAMPSITRSAASWPAASSACSCGTTAPASACSTRRPGRSSARRATTRCGRRCWACTARPRSS